LATGQAEVARRVVAEYAAEGSIAPMIMLRAGPLKYVHCEADPPLLFDLLNDPLEEVNHATDPRYADLVERFAAAVAASWDMQAFRADVLASQARRRIVLRSAAQRQLLSVGLPAPAESQRALYAQSHGPERAGSYLTIPPPGHLGQRRPIGLT
jgi:hypothetical protein